MPWIQAGLSCSSRIKSPSLQAVSNEVKAICLKTSNLRKQNRGGGKWIKQANGQIAAKIKQKEIPGRLKAVAIQSLSICI